MSLGPGLPKQSSAHTGRPTSTTQPSTPAQVGQTGGEHPQETRINDAGSVGGLSRHRGTEPAHRNVDPRTTETLAKTVTSAFLLQVGPYHAISVE